VEELRFLIERLKKIQSRFGGSHEYDRGFWDALEIALSCLERVEREGGKR